MQYIPSIQLEQFSLPKNTLQNLTKTLVVNDCLIIYHNVKDGRTDSAIAITALSGVTIQIQNSN